MLIASWLAVLKAGGVAITTMPVLRERELVYMIGKAKVRFAISHDNLAEDIDRAQNGAPDLEHILYFGADRDDALEKMMEGKSKTFDNVDTAADDPAIIGFTSGSTGTPKGTLHFHRDILAAADCFIGHVVKIRPGDIVCGSPQIAFLYGLCAFIADTFRFGATAVLLERGTPEAVLQTIEKHKATVCFSTPSGYKLMLDKARDYDLSSLRECVGGGEPLLPAIFNEWKEITGVEMIKLVFRTAAPISASGDDISRAIGKAVPGFEVRAVDEQFEDVKPAERPMTVGAPTAAVTRRPKRIAHIQDYGTTAICAARRGRLFYYEVCTDDMILTGGYNVQVWQSGAAGTSHGLAAVVGTPDKDRGQIVKVFITPGRQALARKPFRVADSKSQISASSIRGRWSSSTNQP